MDEEPTISDYNINANSYPSSPCYNRNNKPNALLLCPKCQFNPVLILSIDIDSITPTIKYSCSNCKANTISKISDFINSMSLNVTKYNMKCAKTGHEHITAETYCYNCKKSYCDDCLPLHEIIAPKHILNTNNYTMKRFCNRHKMFALNILCIDCNEMMCSQCQMIHDKQHKCLCIEEYYNKVSKELTYRNYEQFESELKKRGNKIEEIIKKRCEVIDAIKVKLDEYKEKMKSSKDVIYDLNVKNYKKLVEMIYNEFNTCGENNCYKYEVIESAKVLNDVFKKDIDKYELLQKSHEEELKLLCSFKDNGFENIIKQRVNTDEKKNIQLEPKITIKKLNKIRIDLSKSVNSMINDNITDSSATHSMDYKCKTEQKIIKNEIIDDKSKSEVKQKNFLSLSHIDDDNEYPNYIKYQTTKFSKQIVCMVLLSEDLIAIGGGKWTPEENLEINDYTISIFSLSKNNTLYRLRGHQATVSCLFLLKNGYIASGDFDSNIIIWNYKEQKIITKLQNGKKSVREITDFKSDNYLYSFSDDKKMNIWNIDKDYVLIESVDVGGNVYSLRQISQLQVVFGFSKKMFQIYDFSKKKVIHEISTSAYVFSILLINKSLLLGLFNGSLLIYDSDNYNLFKKKKIHSKTISNLIETEPNIVMSSSWDMTIKLWRFANNDLELFNIYQQHSNSILCLMKINKSTIISGACDMKIIVWKKAERYNTNVQFNFLPNTNI